MYAWNYSWKEERKKRKKEKAKGRERIYWIHTSDGRGMEGFLRTVKQLRYYQQWEANAIPKLEGLREKVVLLGSPMGGWNQGGSVKGNLEPSMKEMQLLYTNPAPSSSSREGETCLGLSFPSPSNLLPMPLICQTHRNPADIGAWDWGPVGVSTLSCAIRDGAGERQGIDIRAIGQGAACHHMSCQKSHGMKK